MKKLHLLTLLFGFFLIGCEGRDTLQSSTSGYWLAIDNSYVIEIVDEKLIATNLDNMIDTIFDLEQLDDSRFALYDRASNSYILELNDESNTLRLLNFINKNEETIFKKPLSIKIDDLLGKWIEHSEESNRVNIYTIKVGSYDQEQYIIDHENKEYEYYLNENIETKFSHGFIFTDLIDESKFTYFIKSFDGNRIVYVGVGTDKLEWTNDRFNENELIVPEGYKLSE